MNYLSIYFSILTVFGMAWLGTYQAAADTHNLTTAEQESSATAEGHKSEKKACKKKWKKKCKYGKRTHRLAFELNSMIWSDVQEKPFLFNVGGSYGYNFGYVEVGPNIEITHRSDDQSSPLLFHLGIWGEINFIKNTKRNYLIPGLGLKLNLVNNFNSYELSPYLFLKIFPFKRTAFILKASYLHASVRVIGLDLAYAFYFK